MIETGMLYYQNACNAFLRNQYEKAVEYFIEAYHLGVCQEEILENLYACFIAPNEAEFREHYEKNARGLLDVPYEDLEIDFIPVSDSKFYLFHKPSRTFAGSFELDDSPAEPEEPIEFHSILIADHWDFRQMLVPMTEKNWDIIYILLNEQKNCFASFFKLPRFRERYMQNVMIFEHTDHMRLFFETYADFYLPKYLWYMGDDYKAILNQIHSRRLADSSGERKNVFLSILIPSYNRGNRALAAVREICRTEYDSEIEIIVSDNASTRFIQEYQTIRDMADSRVKYQRNECNVGFLGNVLRLLDLACGEYAVLSSDEDMMLISNLPHYLNVLKKSPDCGCIHTPVIGINSGKIAEHSLQYHGIHAVTSGINLYYMTGLCYHMPLIRQWKITDFIRRHSDNAMVEHYPHCVINFKLALMSDVLVCGNPPLWLEGKPEASEDGTSDTGILAYMYTDSREEQFTSAVKLYLEAGIQGEELSSLYLERCGKFFWLCYLAMEHCPSYYKEHHITWEDLSKDVMERCKNHLMLLEDKTTLEEREILRDSIEAFYQKVRIGKEGFF